MARYVGKRVEIRTGQGTYRGKVAELTADQRVLLEDVDFVDSSGVSSHLPRVRVSKQEVSEQGMAIKLLEGPEDSGVDPVALYNEAEQRVAAPRRTGNRMPTFRNQSRTSDDWAANIENVFPPDQVFHVEQAAHEFLLTRVNAVREMNDSHHYCLIEKDSEKELNEAVRIISSPSFVRVGVAILGSPLSRTTRPAWIVVATVRGIFVFDVRYMTSHDLRSCGLADFLSRPSDMLPRKIIHDSRFPSDSLKHCLNVDLDVFCDTLAMRSCIYLRDCNGKIPTNAWSLVDLLYEYIPNGRDLDLLEYRQNFAQYEYEYEIWNIRPSKESVVHLAASMAVHLCDLYDCLLKAVMEPIHMCSEILVNCIRQSTSAPSYGKNVLKRLPDGIAELSAASAHHSQYVNNQVRPTQYGSNPEAAYKRGLLRCGMGSLFASTSNNHGQYYT